MKVKASTFYSHNLPSAADDDTIGELIKAAGNNSSGRSRKCLHLAHEDGVQEMLNVFLGGHYLRPHRQMDRNKSYTILRGRMDILFFDESGGASEETRMAPPGSGLNFICRFNSSKWHTIRVKSELAVYIETIQGPFRSDVTEFAEWAPGDDELKKVRDFQEKWFGALED